MEIWDLPRTFFCFVFASCLSYRKRKDHKTEDVEALRRTESVVDHEDPLKARIAVQDTGSEKRDASIKHSVAGEKEHSQEDDVGVGVAISPLSRTDRMFLDDLDSGDKVRLNDLCHRLNAQISNCTQSMVDEWARVRHPPVPNDQTRTTTTRFSSQNEASRDVLKAIGDGMLERIENAKAAPSASELEDLAELALRAWAAYCSAMYIFASFPTVSSINDEPIQQFIKRNLVEMEDHSVADKWDELTAEGFNSENGTEITLHAIFDRLVEHYKPQKRLATALRWRALAYKVIHERSGHDVSTKDRMRSLLLEGMGAIIEFADAPATPSFVNSFPQEVQVHAQTMFDAAKNLSDMIHMEFMTAIFEVYAARPGTVYDDSWMEAWDATTVQQDASVVCTAELGLREVHNMSKRQAYPFADGLDASECSSVLMKPTVLL